MIIYYPQLDIPVAIAGHVLILFNYSPTTTTTVNYLAISYTFHLSVGIFILFSYILNVITENNHRLFLACD
jgi:hypothetical protein